LDTHRGHNLLFETISWCRATS